VRPEPFQSQKPQQESRFSDPKKYFLSQPQIPDAQDYGQIAQTYG
jgi:hypothetical protein